MGSFNVGCGLSNLTVHEGDEVGFLLLTENPDLEYHRQRSNRGRVETRTMHIYSTDLYQPYLPPVYGVYDDYGRIAELQESPVTEAIERLFRRPAEAALNAVGQDRGLYSTYGTIAPLYLPQETVQVLGDFSATEEAQFTALGFTPAEAPEGYTRAWAYGDFELRAKRDDEHSSSNREYFEWHVGRAGDHRVLAHAGLALNGLEEVFSTFAGATRLLPGFAEEDHRAVWELTRLSGMFFLKDAYTAVREPIRETLWNKDAGERLEELFTSVMADQASGALYSRAMGDLQRSVGLRDDVWPSLEPLVGAGEFAELSNFLSTMTAVNRMVMPSFNGEQFGNDRASLALARATTALLEARLAEDED